MVTPRYGLVAIVKDGNRDGFRDCLASLRPHIGAWTIVDTGSTDGTQDLVREMLADIPGTLYERPWVNFGHNRSEAFELARGTAEWLIATDADMTWTIDPDYVPPPEADCLLVEMGNGGPFRWKLPLVLSGSGAWASVGAVHEYSVLDGVVGYRSVITDAITIAYPERAEPGKTAWQAGMLEEELAAQPDNARTIFYLAQCYREMGRGEEARALYARRAAMDGFDEERFYARYWAAILTPDDAARNAALMACWESRPWRLEPLYVLLRSLNAAGMHRTAYALASAQVPLNRDTLFLHYSVWDWGMAFERSIAAWWVGNVDEARDLGHQLLTNPRLPDHIRAAVLTNLTYCPESQVA